MIPEYEFLGGGLKTGLSPPVKYSFLAVQRRFFFRGTFMGFFNCQVRLLCLCARLFVCALWSPAGKGLNSWLSFVASNCEFVTFPLVSWVRCGTWLYRFLIFTPLLTYITIWSKRCVYYNKYMAVCVSLISYCLTIIWPHLFLYNKPQVVTLCFNLDDFKFDFSLFGVHC